MMELDAAPRSGTPAELRRTGPVLIGTILAFFIHQLIGVEPATVALTGAAVGLLVTEDPARTGPLRRSSGRPCSSSSPSS